jgi:hypothetical protein
LTIEATSDTTGDKSLGYSTDGAWAEYAVYVFNAGKYTVKHRVAAGEGFGGTVTMKFDNERVASWTIGSTGGWSTWKTIDSCDTFELSKGKKALRIEWSGTASSLVNLNWMDFTYHPESEAIKRKNAAPYPLHRAIAIANGTLSLKCSNNDVKITLHSLDGKLLKSLSPVSRQSSMPVGKGVFILVFHGKDKSVSSIRIVNSRE